VPTPIVVITKEGAVSDYFDNHQVLFNNNTQTQFNNNTQAQIG